MTSRLDLKLAAALSTIVILTSAACGVLLVRTQNRRSLDTVVLGGFRTQPRRVRDADYKHG